MSNTLRAAIDDLAASFASSMVAAIRRANLDEIVALSQATSGAPPRRAVGRPKVSVSKPTKSSPASAKPATAVKTSASPKAPSPSKPIPIAAPVTLSVTKPAADVRKLKGGRLARRSAADIERALARVVDLVKRTPKGLRAEQIRTSLAMDVKEMPRVLKEGLAKKSLKSKGKKRATVYSAA